LALLLHEGEQVLDRERIEWAVLLHPRARVVVLALGDLRGEPTDRTPELERTAGSVAAPEGEAAGLARSGRHEHAVARDLLDLPGRGTEHDVVGLSGLEHHLFVELADPWTVRCDEHAVEPAVGDRAGVHERDETGAASRTQLIGLPIPHDAR